MQSVYFKQQAFYTSNPAGLKRNTSLSAGYIQSARSFFYRAQPFCSDYNHLVCFADYTEHKWLPFSCVKCIILIETKGWFCFKGHFHQHCCCSRQNVLVGSQGHSHWAEIPSLLRYVLSVWLITPVLHWSSFMCECVGGGHDDDDRDLKNSSPVFSLVSAENLTRENRKQVAPLCLIIARETQMFFFLKVSGHRKPPEQIGIDSTSL